MKQGAIFDMDGLMFDTERLYQEKWKEIAAEMGFELAPEQGLDFTGKAGRQLCAAVEKHYHVEDGSVIVKECARRVHKVLEEYMPEKPGLHEILNFFKNNGVKLAVASSSMKEVICNNIRRSGVEEYFDVVVSGFEVACGKPAPDVFLHAAEKLGLDPKDCYVFEDSISGVQAGFAAGCATVMIPDILQPTEELRKMYVGVYTSLLDAMEEIKAGKI